MRRESLGLARKIALLAYLAAVLLACDGNGNGSGDADSDADTDSDTDTDTDSDTDHDTDSDGYCEPLDRFDEAECPESPPEEPCTRFVDTRAPADGDGLGWATAFTSITDGIDSARCAARSSGACQVWVAEGAYHAYHGSPCDTIRLRPGVSVYGGFAGDETALDERDWEANPTVLDGRDAFFETRRVCHVVFGSDDTRLDGFTVTGGDAREAEQACEDFFPRDGAAMLNVGVSSVVVENCTLIENHGVQGVIANVESSVQIRECAFTRNDGTYFNCEYGCIHTAGIQNKDSTVSIQDCVFTNNTGGGIVNYGGTVDITGCTFQGCTTDNDACGIRNQDSSPVVTGCRFLDNEGPAILNLDSSSPVITDCVFAGNRGGVLAHSRSAPVVRSSLFHDNDTWNRSATAIEVMTRATISVSNCTFAGNSEKSLGAIVLWENARGEFTNNIHWNNPPEEIHTFSGTHRATFSSSIIQGGYPGTGILDADPLFADPQQDDYHLQAGSPAIDSADGDAAPDRDLEGNERVDDPSTPNQGTGTPEYADIGCYEFVP